MSTKILLFIATMTLFSCQSTAQSSTDDIKSTLAAYIHAGDINKVKKLEPHLHETFRVIMYDKSKDAVSMLDKATYISFIDTKKFGGYERTADFEDIQLIGENMASVKVTLTSPGKPTLKNFYSLTKTDGKWYVVQDYVTLIFE